MHVKVTRWACKQVATLERADPGGRSVARGVLLADVVQALLPPPENVTRIRFKPDPPAA
jgi:hypothetical protein